MSYAPDTIGAFKYDTRSVRPLVTPEGVALNIRIADIGTRIGAFALDLLFIFLANIAITFAIIYMAGLAGLNNIEFFGVIWALLNFVLRYFYFTILEITPRAATFGKRIMKIRVASRDGGQLKASSVFVRNAVRELEFFIPIGLMFSLGAGVSGWINFAALIWSGIFLLMPLFNKNRLRAGDMLAGTWVVKNPKPMLLTDLSTQGRTKGPEFKFSPKQLQAYGIHELHVLEDVLRVGDLKTMVAVADRIRKKIDWEKDSDERARDFLKAYYAGLRKTLESQMAFGKRRKDKFDV